MVEGIRQNAAEVAEAEAQMAKSSLLLKCQRDGAFDPVTGNTKVEVCKPFVTPKAF